MSDGFNKEKRSKEISPLNCALFHYLNHQALKVGDVTIPKRTFRLCFFKQTNSDICRRMFWHGHNCRNVTPKENKDFGDKKRIDNKNRDERITKPLESHSWLVLRIWVCVLKTKMKKKRLKR